MRIRSPNTNRTPVLRRGMTLFNTWRKLSQQNSRKLKKVSSFQSLRKWTNATESLKRTTLILFQTFDKHEEHINNFFMFFVITLFTNSCSMCIKVKLLNRDWHIIPLRYALDISNLVLKFSLWFRKMFFYDKYDMLRSVAFLL